MVKGTVKKLRDFREISPWFNGQKGFGFITSEEGKDVFVHYSSIVKEKDEYATLNENDKVEFDITEGQKGPQASNVKVTEKAPRQYRPRSGGGGGGGGRGGDRRSRF